MIMTGQTPLVIMTVHAQTCHDIDFEKEIELEERIGAGAFGSVYRGRCARARFQAKYPKPYRQS